MLNSVKLIHWEFILSLGVLGIIWHLLSLYLDNKILLPPPLEVLSAWWQIFNNELPGDIFASLLHLSLGYTIGVSSGFLLALLAVSFSPCEIILDMLVEILRPISAIAWIPIAIAIFGIGELVPVVLIVYVSLFPIYINTVAGIRSVDKRIVSVASTLGASRHYITLHVVLPAALPYVLSGARLSMGVSWMVLIAAELIGGGSGLGWRSFWYEQFFAMHKNMAVILTVGVLGFTLDWLLRMLSARLTHWSPDTRLEG